ncbi:MAG: HAMP domain-containing sensor histidine kinase [Clostridium sp.]
MYLKKRMNKIKSENWNKIGIKKKLFIISTGIVCVTALIIYFTLFSLFPQIYVDSKISNIQSQTQTLVSKMEKDSNFNFEEGINKYCYENGAMAALIDKNANIIYMPIPNKFELNKISPPNNRMSKGYVDEQGKDYQISINVYVKSLNQECILKVNMPIKFKAEIKKIIIVLFPLVLLVTLGLGILSVFVYGKIISNPLLEINSVARDIANLNFSREIEVKGKDEFAELSNSINLISKNLEENINMLEEANSKLKEDIEREKRIDRRRRDFINAISHELKTPITVISGQVEGMIYNIGQYKDRDKYLKETLESVHELNSLVHEIISLAKYEESIGVQLHEVSVNDLVKDILGSYEYFIKSENKKVALLEKNIINKKIDTNIVKKIISNIIGNGIKYSKDTIEIILEDDSLIVKNNTLEEMDEKDLEEIFAPFYRGDKSRNKSKPGTGLGLYIVKSLIQVHGNIRYDVEFENNMFIFKLEFKNED